METSSAETGSSQTTKSGFTASARAIPMRCRRPPSSSCGYVLNRRGARPTVSISSSTRSSRSCGSVIIPCSLIGSSIACETVILGLREENGSWKTICIRVRILRSLAASRLLTSMLSKRTFPAVGSIRRRIARPVVDFPQPDSPTIPSVRPLSMVKETLSTA